MNKCNNCGAEIIDSTFCFQCGEKVDVSNDTNFCQKCSAENNIMNEFCSNCGCNLNSSKSESDKKRDEIVERYDKLAEEFGIGDEDLKKTNAGMNNVYLDRTLYFDNIVSMRVTKSLDDESKFEDITKRVWTSSHDIKKSIKNEIQHFKAMKFKDLIANNDSKDMFNRLLIKLVDNTYYEIRLPSYEFGQKLVDLFEVSKNQVANVIIENQNSQQSKTQLLKEYQKLLKNEIITPEEFKKLKNELIFSNK